GQNGGAGFVCIGLVIGVVLLLGYLLSRRSILRIGSAGGAINFGLQGRIDMREVRAFIDDFEAAKNDRNLWGSAMMANTQSRARRAGTRDDLGIQELTP